MTTTLDEAYDVAVSAATDDFLDAKGVNAPRRRPRSKWARQLQWDAAFMRTVSCRLTLADEERLTRCCKQAGISRHRLIKYMLLTWMAEWETTGVAMHGRK